MATVAFNSDTTPAVTTAKLGNEGAALVARLAEIRAEVATRNSEAKAITDKLKALMSDATVGTFRNQNILKIQTSVTESVPKAVLIKVAPELFEQHKTTTTAVKLIVL